MKLKYPTPWRQVRKWIKPPIHPSKAWLMRFTRDEALCQWLESQDVHDASSVLRCVAHEHALAFNIRQNEKQRIPAGTALVVVSNQTLGMIDTLCLLKSLKDIRPDLKVFADEVLSDIAACQDILVDEKGALAHLKGGGALLFFPANKRFRYDVKGLRDARWEADFLSLTEALQIPILPVFIDIAQLIRWYANRWITGPLEKIKVGVSEKHAAKEDIVIRIGKAIPAESHIGLKVSLAVKAKLFRKEVYRLGRNKKSIFQPVASIAAPQQPSSFLDDLKHCDVLGETKDGMKILLHEFDGSHALLHEIGRLREQAFRLVGEGTGKERDLDAFDLKYRHIVLWDEMRQCIAGAYRLQGREMDAPPESGVSLYTQTLFEFRPNAEDILASGLELGRSFVHPDYWGSKSLDYLWTGIAAFLRKNPQYRYLYGAVSISNSLSKEAKDLLVSYYQQYYGAPKRMANCRQPYVVSNEAREHAVRLFKGLTAKEAFVVLREQLEQMGFGVPVLYKQYTGLCSTDGVSFHGFNVDPEFSDCIDGLVVVDMLRLLPSKVKRYRLEQYHALLHANLIERVAL